MASRDDTTELRADCPNDDVTVLDAHSLAHNINRNQLLLRIVREWACARRHESMVMLRLSAINPRDAEEGGRGRG